VNAVAGEIFGCDILRCVMFFTPEQAFRKLSRIDLQFPRTRIPGRTTDGRRVRLKRSTRVATKLERASLKEKDHAS